MRSLLRSKRCARDFDAFAVSSQRAKYHLCRGTDGEYQQDRQRLND